jgi:hypothetical protein
MQGGGIPPPCGGTGKPVWIAAAVDSAYRLPATKFSRPPRIRAVAAAIRKLMALGFSGD